MLLLALVQMASQAGPAATPEPINQAHWILAEDYPIEAMRNMWDGRVGFTLDVDAGGNVVGCLITQTSGHAVLDVATCDALKARAKFTPAKDSAGLATAGNYTSFIKWAIPDRGPAPLIASSGKIDFDVDGHGNVSNCKSTVPVGSWPNLSDLCSQFNSEANIPPLQFEPRPDGSSRHVTIRFGMSVK